MVTMAARRFSHRFFPSKIAEGGEERLRLGRALLCLDCEVIYQAAGAPRCPACGSEASWALESFLLHVPGRARARRRFRVFHGENGPDQRHRGVQARHWESARRRERGPSAARTPSRNQKTRFPRRPDVTAARRLESPRRIQAA